MSGPEDGNPISRDTARLALKLRKRSPITLSIGLPCSFVLAAPMKTCPTATWAVMECTGFASRRLRRRMRLRLHVVGPASRLLALESRDFTSLPPTLPRYNCKIIQHREYISPKSSSQCCLTLLNSGGNILLTTPAKILLTPKSAPHPNPTDLPEGELGDSGSHGACYTTSLHTAVKVGLSLKSCSHHHLLKRRSY